MRRRSESGFAMLLVFLMAAIIAISLYMELPRVAFESQRQKEQLLIERGEQYKRAIKVFFKTNNRWPAKLEDLEDLNGRRYLRKRYIDPMTGKDEWRPIHIAGGILTDSKVTKGPSSEDKKDNTAGQYISEIQGIGQTVPTSGAGGAAVATRRRASDSMAPGVPTGPGAAPGPEAGGQGQQQLVPGQTVPGAPQQPGLPGAQYPQGVPPQGVPGVPGATGPNGQPVPGQIAPGVPYPGQVRVPGNNPGAQPAPGAQPTQGTGYISGGAYIGSQPTPQQAPAQQYPGQPVNPQAGGAPTPYGIQPGQMPNASGPSGAPPTAQSDAARQMLQKALFGPRPNGPPGVVAGGQVGGTGIAGFASTADAEGIMIYNERSNYGEWEFVYDPSKDRVFNPLAGGAGTPAAQLGAQPGPGMNGGGAPVAPGGAPAAPGGPGPTRR